ncbi:hypothetical protein [Orenia marismortui]|uniref:Uncharacterized protein n=1 Tax=Orenia marismortui TaxID=46469 RepID=A0A4R8H924_9FIRM|nr:hypothetical protein [Orenia marismortui]TDX51904.1 hypothetical protein C7959_10927 [Orenia marismortui]
MVEPINPKTILPRSLQVSKLEQNRKMKPNVNYNQLSQDLQEKSVKKRERVKKSEETEYKKIKDEEKSKQQKRHNNKRNEDEETDDNQAKKDKNLVSRGRHIDIKV